MFGFSVWEIVIIVVVALLVLGPERLPALAKQLAQGMRDFRRAAGRASPDDFTKPRDPR